MMYDIGVLIVYFCELNYYIMRKMGFLFIIVLIVSKIVGVWFGIYLYR